MNFMLWLLSEFGGWLAAGLAAIAAYYGLQWRGEHKGRAEAIQQQEIRNAQAALDAVEISSRPRDVVARGRLRDRHTRSS